MRGSARADNLGVAAPRPTGRKRETFTRWRGDSLKADATKVRHVPNADYVFSAQSAYAPRWFEWNLRPVVTIWEAAALSLNIDPRCLQSDDWFHPVHGQIVSMRMRDDLRCTPREAEDANSIHFDRTETLLRAGRIGALGSRVGVDDAYEWTLRDSVRTDAVLTYLGTSGALLPDEWRGPDRSAQPQYRWPWGDYRTRLLDALADAVRNFWTTYEPEKPGTAPTNAEVAEYLERKLGSGSASIAAAIATIIRADDAPTGRRAKSREDNQF